MRKLALYSYSTSLKTDYWSSAPGFCIRETKFAKSRLVPVLDSTCDASQHYLGHCKNLGAASDNLIVLSGGKLISPNTK